jgi:citrate lyase subunit beta / citryl-CoA lyase
MIGRSWLFVPGDSERKLARALATEADALILDLEDSVAPERRGAARETVASALASRARRGSRQLWVRVNGVASGELLSDLGAVVSGAPDGIVVPKAGSVEEIVEVHHYLAALEHREGLARGSTRILIIATETARALLGLEHLAAWRAAPCPAADGSAPRTALQGRLAGLTWGTEDLGVDIGALEKHTSDGALTPVFELARTLCLVAAAAAGVAAIDGVHVDFRDRGGLDREIERARRDGFAGKLAIHPDQVDAINAGFTPTDGEIARARRIVAAFEASPHLGVTSLDGRMIDRPHLIRARRLLELADARARAASR